MQSGVRLRFTSWSSSPTCRQAQRNLCGRASCLRGVSLAVSQRLSGMESNSYCTNSDLAADAVGGIEAASSSSRPSDFPVIKRKLSSTVSEERSDSDPSWRLIASSLNSFVDGYDSKLPSLSVLSKSPCNRSYGVTTVLVRQNACERQSPTREIPRHDSLQLTVELTGDSEKNLGPGRSLTPPTSADSNLPLFSKLTGLIPLYTNQQQCPISNNDINYVSSTIIFFSYIHTHIQPMVINFLFLFWITMV